MQNLDYLKKTNNFIENYLLNHPDMHIRFIVEYPNTNLFDICIYNEDNQSIVCGNYFDNDSIYKDPVKDEININLDETLVANPDLIEIEVPDKLKGKVVLIDSFDLSTIDTRIRTIKIYMDKNLIRIWADPGAATSFALKLLVFEKEV